MNMVAGQFDYVPCLNASAPGMSVIRPNYRGKSGRMGGITLPRFCLADFVNSLCIRPCQPLPCNKCTLLAWNNPRQSLEQDA